MTAAKLALAAAFAMTAFASPALAQAPGRDRVELRIAVATNDLDLSRLEGADVLLQRLRRAADRACGGRPGVSVDMLTKQQAFDACRARALETAVAQVGSAVVQQRFAESRGANVRVAGR